MRKILQISCVTAAFFIIALCAVLLMFHFFEKPENPAVKVSMIMVNQVGYLPGSPKYCVIPDPPEKEFSIHRLQQTVWTEVLRDELIKGGPELAKGWTGRFSGLREEGIYQIRCGKLRSRCFVVHQRVYDVPMRVLFNYFPWQRCGDSKTGWAAPCHLNDGIIAETGEHIDLTGGYHQSSDLRKWAEFEPIGLAGLVAFGSMYHPVWGEKSIEEEIRWGCDYFHKLVREDGSIPHSVFIPIHWGAREWYRIDAPVSAHWTLIRYLAMATGFFKKTDPVYAAKCREVAIRVWRYMNSEKRPEGKFKAYKIPPLGHEGMNSWHSGFYKGSALDHANRLCAATALFRNTGDSAFLCAAAESASALTALQVADTIAGNEQYAACFWEGPDSEVLAESYFYYWHMAGPLGLCDIVELCPDHQDVARWKRAIERIADQHLRTSGRNPWGLIATRWYTQGVEPPIKVPFTIEGSENLFNGGTLGARETGGMARQVYYEYFPFLYNLDILAAGLFMQRAAQITGKRTYTETAQRQLDWIMGCNPFDASTIEGVGYNQPHRGVFGEFFPPTPQIPGAVSVGVNENSFSQESYGFANEYDMPPTGFALWLMAECTKINNQLINNN